MFDIPEDLLGCFQPFTYCGVDQFGPCTIKDGSKGFKHYGVTVTSLACAQEPSS